MSFSSGAGHLRKSKLLSSLASPHTHPAGLLQPATGNPKRETSEAAVTLTALAVDPLAHWDFIILGHTCKTACVSPLLTTLQRLPFSLWINATIISVRSGSSSPLWAQALIQFPWHWPPCWALYRSRSFPSQGFALAAPSAWYSILRYLHGFLTSRSQLKCHLFRESSLVILHPYHTSPPNFAILTPLIPMWHCILFLFVLASILLR